MEQLKLLLTNPYSWLLIGVVVGLPFLLKLMRRLYPESLRKRMEEEEACTLKLYQNPKIKRLRKGLFLALSVSIGISYAIGYHLIDSSNPLRTSLKVFYPLMITAALYIGVAEYKITKGKNCNDVIVGFRYIKWAGIVVAVIIAMTLIIIGMKELLL